MHFSRKLKTSPGQPKLRAPAPTCPELKMQLRGCPPSDLLLFRRKIRSCFACDRFAYCIWIASVHNRDVHAGIARAFRGAQLRVHSSAAKLAMAIAQSFHFRRQLADGADEA